MSEKSTLKVELVKDLGEFPISDNTKIVAEVVKYNDGPPCLSIILKYKDKAGDWQYGKRPALVMESLDWVLQVVQHALSTQQK